MRIFLENTKRKSSLFSAKISFLFILIIPSHFFSTGQQTTRSKLAIQLLLNTNGGPENSADGVVAFYADNLSHSIGNEDSHKWTNLDENLAINSQGKLLSIEGRPPIQGSDTLNLEMWQFRQHSYYLQLEASNFSPSIKAVVKDDYLQKETEINLASVSLVPFTITGDSASYAANRFSVMFRTVRSIPANSREKFSSIFKESKSLSVTPNPVVGNVVTLHLDNIKAGRYAFNLFNSNGEIIYSTFILLDSASGKQDIVIDKRIHRGSYNLQLTSRDITLNRSLVFE